MEIHLNCDADDSPLYLWLNGRLAAEIVLGAMQADRDKLMDEVVRARRLESLPRILDSFFRDARRCGERPSEGLTPAQKTEEWAMGFRDGLDLFEVATGSVPPLARPSQLVHRHSGKSERDKGAFSLAYKLGYQWGESIRRMRDAVIETANTE